VKWFCIHLATLLVLLIGWFATPIGFLGAFILAAIVFAIAVWAMRHGLAHSTENDTGALIPGVTSEQLERGVFRPDAP
jgi:hypothetical protein